MCYCACGAWWWRTAQSEYTKLGASLPDDGNGAGFRNVMCL